MANTNTKMTKTGFLSNLGRIQIGVITVVCFSAISNLFAQTSWTGTSSTSWTTASNWTNGVPSASTDVIIGDASFTGVNQPKIAKTAKCKSLTIGTGTKASALTVNRSITVAGTITVGTNGTIIHSGYTISLTGDWIKTGTYSATGSNVTVIFAGTSQTINGATAFKKLTINSGSTTTLATATSVSKAFSVSGTFDPGTNLVTLTGSTFSVNASGIILVKASTFAANYSVNPSLNSSSAVDYASSSINQTVSALSYGTLRISGGMVKTLAANTTLMSSTSTTGNVTLAAGTLDLSSFTLNRGTSIAGGSFTMNTGGYLKIGGTNSFPSNYATVNIAPMSTVEYNGTNQSIANQPYGNLVLSSGSGSVTKTMPGTGLVIANDLTSAIGSGTSVSFTASASITVKGNTTIGASTTFNGGSTSHLLSGNFTVNGTFTGSTSTITMGGASMVIGGTGSLTFNNLTVTGFGITASIVNFSVTGNVTTSGPGTFTHNSGGTLTMSGTSKSITGLDISFYSLTISGSVTTASSFIITGNLVVNGSLSGSAGTIQMTGAGMNISGIGSLTFYALRVPGTVSTSISFSMLSDLSGIGKLTATAGTVSFVGSSSFAGAHNLYNVILNGTKLQLGTNATMGVAGGFTIVLGTFDVTTTTPSTVNYNGSGAQNVTGTSYSNLTMSNGGTKTAAGAITVNNDITINSGVTFSASLYTHTIGNNWVNNGTFTAGLSTVQLSGSANSAISGATTFNTFTLNKVSSANFVTLNNSITATTANITTGELRTGNNSLTITSSRTGNGTIMGTIVRTHLFVAGTAYAFESPYNTVTFNTISLGSVTSVTVTVTTASVATFPLEGSINREYTIGVANTGTYTATLRLHYNDSELNGNAESTMTVWHYTTVWADMNKSTADATNNWIEQSSLTDITQGWTLSNLNTTAVWKGTTNSDWATASNWKSGSVPASSDIIQIGTESFTNQPVITSSVTAKTVTFGSVQPTTLTLGIGGSLTINGNLRGDWLADAAHTINVASQTLSVAGDLVTSNGNSARVINVSIGSGTLAISGSLSQTGNASIVFSGTGNLSVGNDFNYTSGTFTASTGTVTYNGTTSQTIAGGIIYNNLTVNKAVGTADLFSTITLNGNLTLSSASVFNMNAAMTVAGDLTINAGATLNEIASSFSLGGNWIRTGTFNSTLGSIVLNGSANQSVSPTAFNDLIVNKSSGSVTPTGNLTINGNLTVTSGTLDLGTYTCNRSVTGGTINLGDGAVLKIAGAASFPSNFNIKTLSATSIVEYNGTIAQTIAAIPYGNLTLSNGGSTTKTLTGSTTVAGDLTINNGATLDGGIYTITLQGNWNNYGTFTPSTSAVAFSGGSSGSNKLINGATTFYNFIMPGYYSTTTGTDLTFLGTFNLSGYLNTGVNTRTYYGDAIVTGSTSEDGVTNIMGQQVQTIRLIGTFVSPSLTSTMKFKGTMAPIIDGTATPVSLINVEVSNTSATGIVGFQDIIVYGTFNVSSGCLWNATSTNATFLSSFTNNGTVIGSGKFTFAPGAPLGNASSTTIALGSGSSFQNTGTVEFGGAKQLIVNGSPTSFNNVIISNTNAAGIIASGAWTINGDISVSSGATFDAGSANYTHTLKGDITVGGTLNGNISTIVFTPVDSSAIAGSGTVTFNNLTISGQVSANTDFRVSGNFTNNGLFDATGSDIYFTGSSSATIGGSVSPTPIESMIISKSSATVTLATNLSGLVSVDVASGILDIADRSIAEEPTNGGALVVEAGATLKVGSVNTIPTFSNGYTFATTSTMEYNGTTQAVSQQSYGNLVLSNSGTKTLPSGTTYVAGNLTVNGTASGNTSVNSGTIYFNGTSTQTASAFTYYNVTVDNTNGISLSGNSTVNNLLTFVNGKLQTNAYIVTLGSSATVSGEASGKYIVGTVQTTQSLGIGSSTFGSIGLSIGSGAENLGNVTVIRYSGPGSAATLGSAQGINRRWDISITGSQPASGRNVTFNWISDDDNGKILSSMILYSRETSSDPWSAKTPTVDASTRSLSYTTTHFSIWTITDIANILPVTLLPLTGTRVDASTVQLKWATASEMNNLGFDVEKSDSGNDFVKIGFVPGNGTSTERKNYAFVDNADYRSSYYRIKQVDFDGNYKYSNVIKIAGDNSPSDKDQGFLIYPNPVKEVVAISANEDLANAVAVELKIIGSNGQSLIVQNGTLDVVISLLNQDLNKLDPGIYYFSLTTSKRNYIQRMLKN